MPPAPYRSRKVRGKPCYRVTNKKNKRVFSNCTTPENAKKQMKLLRALLYNKKFKTNSQQNRTQKRRR